jgi:hypothetical protein
MTTIEQNIFDDFKQRMDHGRNLIKELVAIPLQAENKERILQKINEFQVFEDECLIIWEANKSFLSHNGYCKQRMDFNSTINFYKLRMVNF